MQYQLHYVLSHICIHQKHPLVDTLLCRLHLDGVRGTMGFNQKCPQGNSNPRFGLERAASWATRRWGLADENFIMGGWDCQQADFASNIKNHCKCHTIFIRFGLTFIPSHAIILTDLSFSLLFCSLTSLFLEKLL